MVGGLRGMAAAPACRHPCRQRHEQARTRGVWISYPSFGRQTLTRQIPHRLLQILITRMRIGRCRGEVAVAGELLREEQIPSRPVEICH